MLIGPFGFEPLAHGDTQYSQIRTSDLAKANRTFEYTYNDNGSLIQEANDAAAIRSYTYDYRNRLASVAVGGTTVNYTCNVAGIRVRKHSWTEINGDGQNDDVTTVYVADSHNHTGYAQTLEELVFNSGDQDRIVI